MHQTPSEIPLSFAIRNMGLRPGPDYRRIGDGRCDYCHRPSMPLFRRGYGKIRCPDCVALTQNYPLHDNGREKVNEDTGYRLVSGSVALVEEGQTHVWSNCRLDLVSSKVKWFPAKDNVKNAKREIIFNPPEPPWMLIEFGARNDPAQLHINKDNHFLLLSGAASFAGVALRRARRDLCVGLASRYPTLSRFDWSNLADARAARAEVSPIDQSRAVAREEQLLIAHPGLAGEDIPLVGSSDLALLRMIT